MHVYGGRQGGGKSSQLLGDVIHIPIKNSGGQEKPMEEQKSAVEPRPFTDYPVGTAIQFRNAPKQSSCGWITKNAITIYLGMKTAGNGNIYPCFMMLTMPESGWGSAVELNVSPEYWLYGHDNSGECALTQDELNQYTAVPVPHDILVALHTERKVEMPKLPECYKPWDGKTMLVAKITKKHKRFQLKLEGLVLPEVKRKSIEALLSMHQSNVMDTVMNKWGFAGTIEKGKGMALLFYGPPGTGKTKCAELIAKELSLEFKIIDVAMLWTPEPGGGERIIKQVFTESNKKKTMLCFDECDSLVADRANAGQILGAMINVLLASLERFDGITVFTTNRACELDPAFERRLQLKMEFPEHDLETRAAIWRALIPKKAPVAKDIDFTEFARIPISGGHIKNVILNAARKAAYQGKRRITREHFLSALADEVNGRQAFVESANKPKLAGYGTVSRGMASVEIKRGGSGGYKPEEILS